ncbi:MAG: hypothetical protein FWF28_04725, partial [Micrococcales bacterium]|nr:hypothetical protein [Micrococcales bacterium]
LNNTSSGDARQNQVVTGLKSALAGITSVELDNLQHWSFFDAGDPRVSRYTAGQLVLEIISHNETEGMLEIGKLDPAEAAMHLSRNILTRALGTLPPPKPDVFLLLSTERPDFPPLESSPGSVT